jgi:hypothetical protein
MQQTGVHPLSKLTQQLLADLTLKRQQLHIGWSHLLTRDRVGDG